MSNKEPIAGQLFDVFTEEQLDKISFALSRCEPIFIKENLCHGVDENHIMYKWFLSECFSKVQQAMNNYDTKLVFGMYLNEYRPWGIHTDAYHVKKFANRSSAYSILLPLTVDMQKSLSDQSHTIVFNQSAQDNQVSLPKITNGSEISDGFYNVYLSHNTVDKVKKFSLFDKYQWKRGSLIFWKSEYFHDSDNFHANGYNSKQAIVIHTYYDN